MCCFFLQNIFSCIPFVYRLEAIVNALILVASLHNRRHVHLCLKIRKSAHCFREWLTICRKQILFHMNSIVSVIEPTPLAVDVYRNISVWITRCGRSIILKHGQTSSFILPAWIQYNRMVQGRHIRRFGQPSGPRLIPPCVSHLRLGSSLKVGIPSVNILLRLSSVEVGIPVLILLH